MLLGLADLPIPAVLWQLTEALPTEEPEWIIESRWSEELQGFAPWSGYQVDPDYEPADVDTLYLSFNTNWDLAFEDADIAYYPFAFSAAYLLRFEVDRRWRRQQDGMFRRDRRDLVPPGFYFGAAIAWQSWASEGLGGQSTAALTPIPEVGHVTSTWSDRGLKEALGRLQHGAEVVPLQLIEPPEPTE
jgi:hypothetical protein